MSFRPSNDQKKVDDPNVVQALAQLVETQRVLINTQSKFIKVLEEKYMTCIENYVDQGESQAP